MMRPRRTRSLMAVESRRGARKQARAVCGGGRGRVAAAFVDSGFARSAPPRCSAELLRSALWHLVGPPAGASSPSDLSPCSAHLFLLISSSSSPSSSYSPQQGLSTSTATSASPPTLSQRLRPSNFSPRHLGTSTPPRPPARPPPPSDPRPISPEPPWASSRRSRTSSSRCVTQSQLAGSRLQRLPHLVAPVCARSS